MTRLAFGLVVLAPALALAHGRSVSWSGWTLGPDGAHVELRLAAIDLTLLGLDPWRDAERIGRYAAEHLTLVAGGAPCTPTAPPTVRAEREGQLVVAWSLACASPAPRTIESRLLADVAPAHVHLARVSAMDGTVAERVLTAEASRWPLAGESASAVDFAVLGMGHAVTGLDHVAFLLALLLLAGSLTDVAASVAAFAIAQSVALALATLGGVRPDPAAVATLAGLSCTLVACEGAWLLGGRDRPTPWIVAAALGAAAISDPRTVPPMVLIGLALFGACHLGLLARSERPAPLVALGAFVFGLVHGLGYASALGALGLPGERLVPALFAFNVGVALGQLAIVAVVWSMLGALGRRYPGARGRIAEIGSAAVCGLGLFWFVTRAWG